MLNFELFFSAVSWAARLLLPDKPAGGAGSTVVSFKKTRKQVRLFDSDLTGHWLNETIT
jgi:hypothetical protein